MVTTTRAFSVKAGKKHRALGKRSTFPLADLL
jgi:hypothetical protein